VTDLPGLPAGLTARAMTLADIDAVVALLAAAEPGDDTGEHWDAEDLAGEWDNELVDLAEDGLVVWSGPDLAGWATAIAPPTFRDAMSVYLEGRVHPGSRGRGIGRALLAWQLARGAEVHARRHPEAPARLVVPVPTTMPSLERLVRRAGLAAERRYLTMERELADLPAAPAAEGLDLVPFTWDRDDEVRRAHNVAFAAHHGSSERDPATWQIRFTGRPGFRPELSTLAVADGAVVAYTLVYVFESDTRATGRRSAYLGQIGALPQVRGRGLATAAIATSLRAAARHGCDLAALDVDSENGTGAVGLYERLGFRVARERVSWSRRIPPLAAR
jgi:ribosomal protein S18 acetylase RimI-like enzyme